MFLIGTRLYESSQIMSLHLDSWEKGNEIQSGKKGKWKLDYAEMDTTKHLQLALAGI